MKAVITGATGCVGRNLVDALIGHGWEIVALHRKTSDLSRLAGCDLQCTEVDLLDLDSVRAAIPNATDAVFHVAANVSHWPLEAERQWQDNVIATRNLVQASLDKGVKRFIFTSTGAAARADQATRIRSGYILSKRQSELEVEQGIARGLDAVILRLPIVIGKYDYNNYARIFQELKSGKIQFALPGTLVFGHARDIAEGHLQAYVKAKRGEYYYFGGEQTSWYDVFVRISKLVGVKPPPKPFPLWVYYSVSYGMLWLSYLTRKEPLLTPELIYLVNASSNSPDVVGFRRDEERAVSIGYHSAPLDEALLDCYAWLVANDNLQ